MRTRMKNFIKRGPKSDMIIELWKRSLKYESLYCYLTIGEAFPWKYPFTVDFTLWGEENNFVWNKYTRSFTINMQRLKHYVIEDVVEKGACFTLKELS